MMFKIYGIKNCDKIKKLLKEADKNSLNYEFIDFKKNPPSIDKIKKWGTELGAIPLNSRSRVFREFKDEYDSCDQHQKLVLLTKNTSAIIRPIVEKNDFTISAGAKSINEFL